jgi:hypothetical protein
MALIGVAFGLGFTFGPLLGYLAVPSGDGDPGPGPGYAAAALSAIALALAYFLLTESRQFDRQSAQHALLDMGALARSLSVPSIGALLVTSFVCVFSFANFETTLSIVIKGHEQSGPFHFSFRQVCLTFAYIGFVLALVQGLLVRKLSGRVSEGWLASAGARDQKGGGGRIGFEHDIAR